MYILSLVVLLFFGLMCAVFELPLELMAFVMVPVILFLGVNVLEAYTQATVLIILIIIGVLVAFAFVKLARR